MALSIYTPDQFVIGQPGPFGLKPDQVLAEPLLHNSNWYNKCGRKLSSGDLGAEHVSRIGREIAPSEMFIVMEQGNFNALYHTARKTNVNELPPRLLSVHARLIIARDTLLHINMMARTRKGVWHGIPCTNITPQEAEDVLKAANAK